MDLAKEAEGNSSALKKFAEVAIAPPPQPAGTESLGADEKSRAELRARLLAEQKGHLASGASKVDQAPAAPKTSEEFAKETSRPVIADSGLLGQKQKAENFRQQFSQTSANEVFRRDVKLQRAANVLDNFQVEQDGRQIRVVDADGSTYTGKIERLSQNDTRNLSKEKQNYAARSARTAAAAPTKDADGSTSDEFYFHATGYSGSLKKSLIFEGNYIVTASPRQKASDDLTSKKGDGNAGPHRGHSEDSRRAAGSRRRGLGLSEMRRIMSGQTRCDVPRCTFAEYLIRFCPDCALA